MNAKSICKRLVPEVLLTVAALVLSGCSADSDDQTSKRKVSEETVTLMQAYSHELSKLEEVGCEHDYQIRLGNGHNHYSARVNCGLSIFEDGNPRVIENTEHTIAVFESILASASKVSAKSDTPSGFLREVRLTSGVLRDLLEEEFIPTFEEYSAYEDPLRSQDLYLAVRARLVHMGVEFTRTEENGRVLYGIVSSNVDRDSAQDIVTYTEALREYKNAAIVYGNNKRADVSELKSEARVVSRIVEDSLLPALAELLEVQLSLMDARLVQDLVIQYGKIVEDAISGAIDQMEQDGHR